MIGGKILVEAPLYGCSYLKCMFTLITQAEAKDGQSPYLEARHITGDQHMEYTIASNGPIKGGDADSELHQIIIIEDKLR
jgi:hypothetical protein